ncbi:glycosyltransferase WbuB [Mesorhizobium sp. M4A.F.Ca.ET.022.05.2.1]|uniref:glycosyltransferase family 4 protein n=1 Tax=Mesorhizobium sp. M4A.F.Ca.ET.022.05.2.1 TaxID=2496653 RepID=UPI000FCB01A7|nr:glycosyltransferase family 4 protein [Mesorhizobium sp. M4A.F.Ca.ET.022.05.2.1]RVC83927.1 glycosyltransferase WbuB [Mesorhizobium sp. M4A.F.Ca.ET.022.05.2.1]
MRIALIADTFPPLRTSGAVQLRDLSREFARQGHQLTVMLPAAELDRPWAIEDSDGVTVLRLRAPPTKEIGYVRRTWNEFVMPFAMLRNLRKSPLAGQRWDGIVWYAPSIFHGPMVNALKRESGCKGYLIIRDIFPEWAVDMGLMGRGLPYRFFDAIARYQYSIADVIGVQTPGNLAYFNRWRRRSGRVLEVLQNWLDKPSNVRCSIRVSETPLAGRKLFVYAGNMGVAQSVGIVLDLAQRMASRTDVGFLLVGRGSEARRLREKAQALGLTNVVFFDEIDPDEIPDLYAQCRIGIVSLDLRHRSHNIPGKFLTYMQSGLPALVRLNPGNDLAELIRSERVGEECQSDQLDELVAKAERLLVQVEADAELPGRCRRLFDQRFSTEQAAAQIADALSVP